MTNDCNLHEFIFKLKNSLSNTMNLSFHYGYVKRLSLNNKEIYLWQDVKGNICYSFDLLDKDYDTTTISKLGNVLTSHFGMHIEVANNINESFKKLVNAKKAVSKAVTDSQRHSDYIDYRSDTQEQFFGVRGIESNTNQRIEQFQIVPQQQYNQNVSNQQELFNEIIEMTVYEQAYIENVYYIWLTELPLIKKEVFKPEMNSAFFMERNLIYKNSYIATEFMAGYYCNYNIEGSFIIAFISFLAKNDPKKAMWIISVLANGFNSLNKFPFVLVLYSEDEVFMKILYEEIIVPLFNIEHCEKIDNGKLDEKSLSKSLDKKVVSNFHNITSTQILDMKSKDFTNRLLYKDECKLNNKIITTKANILITSTTKYIPLVANDVPYLLIDVASNLDAFCKKYNITSNYHFVANLIKQDLTNFVGILRNLNMPILNNACNFNQYNETSTDAHILDGNTDIVKVFIQAIKTKDLTLFKSLEYEKPSLYITLVDDFKRNRVDKKNLILYFTSVFGEEIYKKSENRKFIARLKDLSLTDEPFENDKTHVRTKRGYYFL